MTDAMRKLPRDLVLILRTEAQNQRTPPIDYVIAEDGGRMVHRPEPDIAMAELLEEAADALTTERAAHAETKRERDALRDYAHEATKVITNIAGGGSELFGRQIGGLWAADLAYCDKVIRERRPHMAEVWKESRLREVAEAQHDEALKALEPFAKAGELFPGDDADFDQCIYRPAAGDEYALSGNHLRAARRALTGGKKDG